MTLMRINCKKKAIKFGKKWDDSEINTELKYSKTKDNMCTKKIQEVLKDLNLMIDMNDLMLKAALDQIIREEKLNNFH